MISRFFFFESIMLVGPKAYVERHRCVRSLCLYACSFIPAFIDLLPSLLSNLIASTLALRTQACHALCGFVLKSTSIPISTAHTRISNTITAYLTTISPSPNAKSPSKATGARRRHRKDAMNDERKRRTPPQFRKVQCGPSASSRAWWSCSDLNYAWIRKSTASCRRCLVWACDIPRAPFARCAASRGGRLPVCISGLRCQLNRTPRSEVDDDVRKKRKRQYAHQAHLRVMSSVECQAGWRPSLRCWQRTTTRMTTTTKQRRALPFD